jgi:drug/metabolite transporter (DMT)-like permease
MSGRARGGAARLVAAFLAIYVIWGSTYLAIRVAIESVPPFLMASARFLAAGAILFAWTRARGGARATWRQWRSAAVVGTLLLAGGNGAVVWSEQRVPSGAVALLVATVPLWMVVLAWLWKGGPRPDWRVATGIALGLAGIAVLIGPEALGAGKVDALGAVAVLFGSLAWASGSIYSRTADLPGSQLLATGMEMLAGGAALGILGVASGELGALHFAQISGRSTLAIAYLVVFGSLVAFTAYVWLLKATTPARVATYAYVNPVVAVVLGWAFAGEPLGGRTLLSAGVVLGAVALISVRTARGAESDASRPPGDARRASSVARRAREAARTS